MKHNLNRKSKICTQKDPIDNEKTEYRQGSNS